MKISLAINEARREVEVDDDMPLLWILRDSLGMTGTKFGCGVGVCGSCTVLENGKAVRSCQIPAHEAKERSFTTIEGLSPDGDHPCQRAWLEGDVAQCGYCQPGMIMTTAALVAGPKPAGQQQVEAALAEHICRCGTYGRMQKAVARVVAGAKA